MPASVRYATTTLPPLILLILAGTLWGSFAWIALASITLVAAPVNGLSKPPARPVSDTLGPWATTLAVTLALGHFAVVLASTQAIAAGVLTLGQNIALLIATALFIGQVSHPNAHDLIHRRSAVLRALGAAVYTSVGFGHHVSAHKQVHHCHVGTDDDPYTPRPGESFHSYLRRAWREGFEVGIVAEIDRLDRRGCGPNHISNPYWRWLGGAVLALVLVSYLGGPIATLTLIALGLLTGAQVLMSDYLHHYGLQRLLLPNGRLESPAAHHRWIAPRGLFSPLMTNASADAMPHLPPNRTRDCPDPQIETPTLPFPMPAMAAIALIPPLWHRMMDPRALKIMEAVEEAHKHLKQPAPVPQPATGAAAALPLPISVSPGCESANTAAPISLPNAPATLVDDAETDALLSRIQAATR